MGNAVVDSEVERGTVSAGLATRNDFLKLRHG
jgi:hypothetical protein